MSRVGGKQVGKQVVRRRRRRIRYDLMVFGLILIAVGFLVYNVVTSVTTPIGGGAAESGKPLDLLRRLADTSTRKNESVILVYRIRGELPTSSYTLGTLDYVYVYISKEFLLVNESEKIAYTTLLYAVQGPLNLVAEVLGLGFKSEALSDVFFNPTVRTTWANLTIEEGGVEQFTSELLGGLSVLPQTYRYLKTIEGRSLYIEVKAFRAVDLGLIPVRVEASVGSSRFSLELVEVRGV